MSSIQYDNEGDLIYWRKNSGWSRFLLVTGTLAILWSAACRRSDSPLPQPVRHTMSQAQLEIPFGLPEFREPAGNPITVEKLALGKKLFFDQNLSADRTVSCASCHDPALAWTNGQRFAEGVGGATGTRNVPSLINVVYFNQLFWDGRAGSLERQALFPLLNPDEMAMPSSAAIVERLHEDQEYRRLFESAFPDGITIENLTHALASYQRTILAGDSAYDRYVAGEEKALSEQAIRGMNLFVGRAKCSGCHVPPTFIDHSFYNLGVGMDSVDPDLGRYHVFKMESAKGQFKTPTLRDVALTAPYMHDGSIDTLEEVVELYDQGGTPNPYLSREIRQKLRLTAQEKSDLVAFMREGLSSNDGADP